MRICVFLCMQMLPAPTASKTCAKQSLRHSFNPQHFSLGLSYFHAHLLRFACALLRSVLSPPSSCPCQALAFLYAICYCHSSTPGDAACCWPCAARCVVLLHALPLLAVLLACYGHAMCCCVPLAFAATLRCAAVLLAGLLLLPLHAHRAALVQAPPLLARAPPFGAATSSSERCFILELPPLPLP
jgi:hypothetical protein